MRRRTARRRGAGRRGWGRLLLIVVLVILALAAVYVVVRQYRGYLSEHHPSHRVGVVSSPSPSPVVPAPSAPVSPQPSSVPPGPLRVAVIIDDCGYNVQRDLRFLDLGVPITFSVLPLTPHGTQVVKAAEAAGQPVILHIPMEPESPLVKPGPGAILTEMTDTQIRAQLEADIASLPPMPGANNHEGSKASSDERVMTDVLDVLKSDGMFFIDSRTALTSVGEATARRIGVPTAHRDVFLDNQATIPYVEAQIARTEAVARRDGYAIAIGHPNVATAAALEQMVPRMRADGFTFVSAQSLVH